MHYSKERLKTKPFEELSILKKELRDILGNTKLKKEWGTADHNNYEPYLNIILQDVMEEIISRLTQLSITSPQKLRELSIADLCAIKSHLDKELMEHARMRGMDKDYHDILDDWVQAEIELKKRITYAFNEEQ